jgi:hypothetical protein
MFDAGRLGTCEGRFKRHRQRVLRVDWQLRGAIDRSSQTIRYHCFFLGESITRPYCALPTNALNNQQQYSTRLVPGASAATFAEFMTVELEANGQNDLR